MSTVESSSIRKKTALLICRLSLSIQATLQICLNLIPGPF
jgi:hypothetical protein